MDSCESRLEWQDKGIRVLIGYLVDHVVAALHVLMVDTEEMSLLLGLEFRLYRPYCKMPSIGVMPNCLQPNWHCFLRGAPYDAEDNNKLL